jgi:hypothetical protein
MTGIEAELELAELARKGGNEGRARVCARRAAGWAAQGFLTRRGVGIHRESVYAALRILAEFPGLDPHLRQAAENLTTRIGGDPALPAGADLIADARRLIGGIT